MSSSKHGVIHVGEAGVIKSRLDIEYLESSESQKHETVKVTLTDSNHRQQNISEKSQITHPSKEYVEQLDKVVHKSHRSHLHDTNSNDQFIDHKISASKTYKRENHEQKLKNFQQFVFTHPSSAITDSAFNNKQNYQLSPNNISVCSISTQQSSLNQLDKNDDLLEKDKTTILDSTKEDIVDGWPESNLKKSTINGLPKKKSSSEEDHYPKSFLIHNNNDNEKMFDDLLSSLNKEFGEKKHYHPCEDIWKVEESIRDITSEKRLLADVIEKTIGYRQIEKTRFSIKNERQQLDIKRNDPDLFAAVPNRRKKLSHEEYNDYISDRADFLQPITKPYLEHQMNSLPRNLITKFNQLSLPVTRKLKFWNKKSFQVNESNPSFKVIYLGNLGIQLWSKDEQCLEKPIASLWKNYVVNMKSEILMRLTICNSGLKAVTRQHGLTQYWSNRLGFCGSHKNHPRIFAWIYRHEGKKMRQELRCHAVLCPSIERVNKMVTMLNARLSCALQEFRREKKLTYHNRTQSSNNKSNFQAFIPSSTPLRKQLLAKGTANFRPPLERSKSAPKLSSIIEEESDYEDDFLSNEESEYQEFFEFKDEDEDEEKDERDYDDNVRDEKDNDDNSIVLTIYQNF